MKYLIVRLITFYQIFLSFDNGLLRIFASGGACRYTVSCSQYFKQAILKYGLIKGIRLGFVRLLSCSPLT